MARLHQRRRPLLALRHTQTTTNRPQNAGTIESRELQDHVHLFFQCPFSRMCMELVQRWLGRPMHEDLIWYNLERLRGGSMLARLVLFTAYSALTHHVWEARNICRLQNYVRSPVSIVSELKFEIKVRIASLNCTWKESDRDWLGHFDLL
ncbi:hypothetical protein RND81_06G051700 [Saponaria officinalis]|uniref:Uncharacterized protein n=1 Tax=Saponaria officinalis TaxID=3572 RepID=A0AAW1K7E1_SAPOF